MSSFEEQVKKMDLRGIIITSNLTAFSIVVALLWKDTLSTTFAKILPHTEGLTSLYLTSIIGTFFIVVIAYMLLKTQEINKKHIYTFRDGIKTRAYRSERFKEIKAMVIQNKKFKYKYRPRKSNYFF